jgi:PAS domain S-box-containing protein
MTDDLQNLLTSTNIATIFLDRQFRITRFTPAMTQLVNLLATDLKRPIGDFVQKFTDQRLIPDAEQVLLDLRPREAEVRTDAGQWYLRRILPYRTEDDRIDGVVVTFTDITERRTAEQNRLRIAAIVESAEVAIIGKTLDGTVTTWNRGAEILHGYSASEAVGRSIDFILPPEEREHIHEVLGRVARGETVELESVRLHRQGRRVHVLLTVSPVYDTGTGELIGASSIARDITSRREAEEEVRRSKEALETQVAEQTRELRQANERLVQEVEERRRAEEVRKLLVQRLMTIENDERRRISRELHDQIGQHLAALTLRLKTLEPAVPDADGLKAAQELVDDVGRQVHDLALEVRPTALDELGLLPAVSNYAEEWARRNRIQLDFHTRGFGQTRLPLTVEETIYRVVLESLTNVGKHARANRVSLILERRDSEARAIIEDDGIGFDPEELKSADGRRRLGLLGMEERAGMVHGALTMESRPGSGTTVFLRVPIQDFD